MKKYKKILWYIFFCVIALNVGITIFSHLNTYTSSHFWQQFPQLKKEYENSQYMRKHQPTIMSDVDVNSYAGGAYIIGTNPIYIAPDTPPLGRYIIGLSALIFNNPNVFNLCFIVLSLWLLYLVGKQIYISSLTAMLVPFFFSFEPIFKDQIIETPLLDIMQLVFLLTTFYFFNKGQLQQKKTMLFFLLAAFFLGCFITTKFYVTGITIIAACYAVLLFHKDIKKMMQFTFALPLALIMLFGIYIRALFFDSNIHRFFGIQKYIFLYHKSQLILPFTIWPLILFDTWYVWFGNKPTIPGLFWTISWPIITIVSLLTVAAYGLKKIKQNRTVEVLMLWEVFYLLFFSFGQIAPRYLLILLPVAYLVTFYCIETKFLDYYKAKK